MQQWRSLFLLSVSESRHVPLFAWGLIRILLPQLACHMIIACILPPSIVLFTFFCWTHWIRQFIWTAPSLATLKVLSDPACSDLCSSNNYFFLLLLVPLFFLFRCTVLSLLCALKFLTVCRETTQGCYRLCVSEEGSLRIQPLVNRC